MFHLLFRRRHYAIQIVEKFEENIKSRVATELIEMIIYGSKANSFRSRLSVIDNVMVGADGIIYNSTAATRLKRELNLDDGELAALRQKLSAAINTFMLENGRVQMMSVFNELPHRKQPKGTT